MRDLILLFVHVLATSIRLARPEGVRSVLVESALLKPQFADFESFPPGTESPGIGPVPAMADARLLVRNTKEMACFQLRPEVIGNVIAWSPSVSPNFRVIRDWTI